jgi:GT2 family glycosyltransferase
MPSSTDRWVIVLNFEGREDTLELLDDLDSAAKNFTVLVVDNGSADGLLDHLGSTKRWAWVRTLQTGSNLGYAGGNNAGIKVALAEGATSICVLNNDTRAQPQALNRLFALATGDVALCPDIAFTDDREGSWFRGARFDEASGRPVHLGATEQPSGTASFASPYLTGCCLVTTAAVWRRVGLFDETYFLIFEDSDWSARARAAGVRLEVHPEVRIQHKVSRSFTGARQGLGIYYYSRNGLRFARRHGQRGSLGRFLRTEVLRPAVRDIVRGDPRQAAVRLISVAHFPTTRAAGGSAVGRLSFSRAH